MASRATLSLIARLAVVFLAGLGAQAALQAGYFASLAVCLLLAAWALADLLLEARQRAEPLDDAGAPWASAVLAREREARTLAAFLDQAPVPLLTFDAAGKLSALNLAARQFFNTDDLIAAPAAPLLEAVRAATPGQRQAVTLEVDGAPRAYALTAADLLSAGDAARVVALMDVQAEIQAAEAAALRELIQVLSHEIMNSLTPVTSLAQTAAELLADDQLDPAGLSQAREATRSVATRSEGLLRFIEAYRALARLPEPRFADVSLAEMLSEVALLFRSRWGAAGVQLAYEAPPTDAHVAMDRDLFVQALLNVLSNAAEAAIEAGGSPAVRLSAKRTRGRRLVIEVEDNGPGVRLADPNMIFRPFFTTKAQGTGVGLSLARQVVLAHGGAISVAKADSGGAKVAISL